MTSTDFLREFRRLPFSEQAALAKAIQQHAHDARHPQAEVAAALPRLRGSLRGPQNVATDVEIDAARDEYLMKKFG